jgi:hypothetical protein
MYGFVISKRRIRMISPMSYHQFQKASFLPIFSKALALELLVFGGAG